MGKDREGKFHPKKGKPSGNGDEGLGLRPSITPEELEQDLAMTDKYTKGPDELADNVRLLHRNRNTNKRKNVEKKEPGNESDKTVNETFTEEVTKTEAIEILGIPTKEQLAELAAFKGDTCITIYLDSHKSGVEVNEQQDLIAFKNILQQTEAALNKRKIDELSIKKLLKPGYDLLRDNEFWRQLTEGMVFFIADDYFTYAKLSFSPLNDVMINQSFNIGPLAEGMLQYKYFYLVVMSKKQVKLYRADQAGMEQLTVPGMPNGVEDVVHLEEKDNQQMFRLGSGGKGGASFHGMGSGQPDEKTNLALYLEEADDTIWKEVLHAETAPLLLAGIEYMVPIYKQVTDYKHIWPEAIVRGALEHETDAELYAMAMEKMEPYFRKEKEQAIKQYYNQSATPLTTALPSVIIPAAHYGRIHHLFVHKGAHIWGSFNEQDNQLFMDSSQKGNEDCLVNKAIIKTILTGGNVFLLSKEEMPDQATLAAVMRY